MRLLAAAAAALSPVVMLRIGLSVLQLLLPQPGMEVVAAVVQSLLLVAVAPVTLLL
jgi:hypothetical protein